MCITLKEFTGLQVQFRWIFWGHVGAVISAADCVAFVKVSVGHFPLVHTAVLILMCYAIYLTDFVQTFQWSYLVTHLVVLKWCHEITFLLIILFFWDMVLHNWMSGLITRLHIIICKKNGSYGTAKISKLTLILLGNLLY
jgi:hypothetical protein